MFKQITGNEEKGNARVKTKDGTQLLLFKFWSTDSTLQIMLYDVRMLLGGNYSFAPRNILKGNFKNKWKEV